jgi:hypothetical protein
VLLLLWVLVEEEEEEEEESDDAGQTAPDAPAEQPTETCATTSASAATTVSSAGQRRIELTRHIAGDWELLNAEGRSVGSVSFDRAGHVSSHFLTIEALSHPDNYAEDEILRPRDVVPQFSSLDTEWLTYATTHRACGSIFGGELTIRVLDRDQIQGELHASEPYDVHNRDPNYAPYGLDAEFIGRRMR